MAIEVGCPACGEAVDYEELENDGDHDTKCPSCGATSPNDEWFEEE